MGIGESLALKRGPGIAVRWTPSLQDISVIAPDSLEPGSSLVFPKDSRSECVSGARSAAQAFGSGVRRRKPRVRRGGADTSPSSSAPPPPRTPPAHSLRLLPPLPSRQCHRSRWLSGLVSLLGFFYVDLRKAQQFPCSTRAPKQGSYPFHPKTQPFWTLEIPPPTFLSFPFRLL